MCLDEWEYEKKRGEVHLRTRDLACIARKTGKAKFFQFIVTQGTKCIDYQISQKAWVAT